MATRTEIVASLLAERYGELPPRPPQGANLDGPTACWMRHEDEVEFLLVEEEIWRESEESDE